MNNNDKDIKFAENMRRSYSAANGEISTADKLRELDREVKRPGRAASISVGTIGSLVMGGGMSLVMTGGSMAAGLALGIPGMIAAVCAYPIYSAITNSRKEKYAPQVIELTDKLIRK